MPEASRGPSPLSSHGSSSSCPKGPRYLDSIQNADLNHPRSWFDGWEPPCQAVEESYVVHQLSQSRLTTVDLVNFAIYRSRQAMKRPGELVCLSFLKTAPATDDLYFDGCVKIGDELMYLENIKFGTMAIEGYGDLTSTTVKRRIFIQSRLCATRNIFLRLSRPALEYQRYHDVFLWIANLTKYAIDFMLEPTLDITLRSFRSDFVQWTGFTYGNEPKFLHWLSLFKGTDFRAAISAHIQFVYKEAWSIDHEGDLLRHPLWKEVGMPALFQAIPAHITPQPTTAVTPFVHEVFRNMYFGSLLKTVERTPAVLHLAAQRRCLLGLTPLASISSARPSTGLVNSFLVRKGDIIALKPDTVTAWKGTGQAHWYAYVQAVHTKADGRHKLDLLWLYNPSDTSIGRAHYPFKNELFLSDNCSCGAEAYDMSQALGKVDVLWGRIDPLQAQKKNAFVVRQTYMTDTHEFVNLHKSHFTCRCKQEEPSVFEQCEAEFKKGDFVLYRCGEALTSKTWVDDPILYPAQILDFLPIQQRILLRQLSPVAGNHKNQVSWSNDTFSLNPDSLVRRCQVMGFPDMAAVTEVCLRGGVGDIFYYLYHGADPNSYAVAQAQAAIVTPKLQGMGICCGGGSFDRGLEDGNAVEFKHAIDFDARAIHTYRANTEDPNSVNFFLGPMERYLADAIAGNSTPYPVALINEIDVMAAGSPCPGFSRLQTDRLSDRSKKLASLVACVMAYVDHYMPCYFILENVLGMSLAPNSLVADQNVLPQLVGCLVALGYQTQQILIDAPAFGSFQNRHRVFVLATAPAMEPLCPPQQSSHRSTNFKRIRSSLGRLSNGLRYGAAEDELAPFHMTTFEQGTNDLPDIGDGHVHACISHPDHRVGDRTLPLERHLIAAIPKRPYGTGIARAHVMGKVAKPQQAKWLGNPLRANPRSSRAFRRIVPHALMNTLTTTLHPNDSFTGQCLHPEQNRVLTVMEARRAQGIPDHEVILGGPREQWKIIGNSVHRYVAFALGLSLKEAWQKSQDAIDGITA